MVDWRDKRIAELEAGIESLGKFTDKTEATMLERLRALEAENACLRKRLKERAMGDEDKIMLKAITEIPNGWRLYSVDASIPGRYTVMLIRSGAQYKLWFLLDAQGMDSIPLYCTGVAGRLDVALSIASGKARGATDIKAGGNLLPDLRKELRGEHNTESEDCWCNPDKEETEDGVIVIHRDKSEAN